MLMTEPMVLPLDLLVVPVKDLPDNVRQQVQAEEGDFALTRPNSRTPSRIVDSAAAELLEHFRTPVTIVEAVIRYSRGKDIDPEQTLEEAFPMLERLAKSRLLLPSDLEEAKTIAPSLEVGSRFLDFEVVRCVQSLEDTELYQLKSSNGDLVALKLARANAPRHVQHMFDREAAILERLAGEFSPKLLRDDKTENDQRYLLLEWCDGKDCTAAAAPFRNHSTKATRRQMLLLCCSILDAYVQLHERTVVHSDIHSRNVIVDDAGKVKLIDFGYARISGIENTFRHAQRAGVAFFFEPEYASTVRAQKSAPPSTALGEQYALGALLYMIVTGNQYLDFSFEKDEMIRQIVEDAPVAFATRGSAAWPELEEILAKSLSKRPLDRFASIADFVAAIRVIVPPEPSQ